MRTIWAVVIVIFIVGLAGRSVSAQQAPEILNVIVKSADGPVRDAKVSVRGTSAVSVSDTNGRALLGGLQAGQYVLEVLADGYRIAEIEFNVPRSAELVVELEENESVVTISTTRTGREIDDTPTRVEAIDAEEIDEKSSMRPANVSMLLNESTGVKVQQTSATTFTQSIRNQGLDGRYTQLLKDGFPTFGGFSASLGVLDIPPLDLKQVEIIKGASSTFFGGGAIAGVVNFISKEPGERPQTSLILNQTSALGSDASVFHTRRGNRLGLSLFGAFNYQRPYDADGDRFTELPLTYSFSADPKLFVYGKSSRFVIGNSTSFQSRDGGDLDAIGRGATGRYMESHRSLRNVTTIAFEKELGGGGRANFKQSLAYFRRSIEIPGYRFAGRQVNSFTEASVFKPAGRHFLVFGANAFFDKFSENRPQGPARDESRLTLGAFVQDTVEISRRLSVEAGIRIDKVRDYGTFVLPRASLLYRISEAITGRLTVGFGYKPPTIFTEEAETLLFRDIVPIGNTLRAETSRGATFDVNYRRRFGEKASLSVNQMFFFTEIRNPLVLERPAGRPYFSNSPTKIRSAGFEANLRFSYDLVKLFAGYTFTDAVAGYLPDDRHLALTPKSKLNSALLIEKEGSFKAGVEAYFTGRQLLGDRSRTKPFWVVGLFGERIFKNFSLFFNAENLTDTRQSRFAPVVLPPYNDPTFAEIWTHTEGRIFNGGVKLRF